MSTANRPPLTTADYPLAERRPDLVRSPTGKAFDEITLEAVRAGSITMADLRISAAALRQQAEIARAAGRVTLGQNFDRAAELVDVPQDELLRVYELLRPGRAKSKAELLAVAAELRQRFKAEIMADFVAEAAAVYEKRGLFINRF